MLKFIAVSATMFILVGGGGLWIIFFNKVVNQFGNEGKFLYLLLTGLFLLVLYAFGLRLSKDYGNGDASEKTKAETTGHN